MGISELTVLKRLLNSNDWPEAASNNVICDPLSESAKIKRAEGVVDLIIDEYLEGKKFLDIGCGEAHVASFVSEQLSPQLSVGYDIHEKDNEHWNKIKEDYVITSDFDEVKLRGPYDVILMYDVLDHTENETPIELLMKVKLLVKSGTRIYIRNHPWCCRHGSHLYYKINKAFVHLVFSEEEFVEMGIEVPHTLKVTHPRINYDNWLKSAGFPRKQAILTRKRVEPFFRNHSILVERIRSHWKKSKDKRARRFPEYQMSQSFLDYHIVI